MKDNQNGKVFLYEKYLISFVKPLISSNFAIVLKQNER